MRTITITVTVTPDCEDLLTTTQRTHEWEITNEEYTDGGEGTITFNLYDGSLGTMQSHLDQHPGVIEYTVV